MACLNAKKTSQTNCNDKITKGSLVLSVISLIFASMLFARMQVMQRKAESVETKLENRVQRIENDMQAEVQRMVQAMLHSTVVPLSRKKPERDSKVSGEYCFEEICDCTISCYSVNRKRYLSWFEQSHLLISLKESEIAETIPV